MRLVSLNIWKGKVLQPLTYFLKEYADKTDIFCFQEIVKDKKDLVSSDGDFVVYPKVREILGDFNDCFENHPPAPHVNRHDITIFTRKNIEVQNKGDILTFFPEGGDEFISKDFFWRNMHYIQFTQNSKKFTIANFHGLWDGPGKDDNSRRLDQSKKVREFMDTIPGHKILIGDFNIWPDTESLKILEDGMVNLIEIHNIHSTRSRFVEFPNKYSDYALVSPDIKVNDFKVLDYSISDHLPLYLDFE